VFFRGIFDGASRLFQPGGIHLGLNSFGLSELENELGVMFCSQDLSDAMSVSRIWEGGDAAIVVFGVEVFLQEVAGKRAAVIGFAEAGILFRYPFLERPLLCEEVTVVIRPHCAPCSEVAPLQVALPPSVLGDRAASEQAVWDILARYALKPAVVRYGGEYPRLQSKSTL
jgi:hypothetical protein